MQRFLLPLEVINFALYMSFVQKKYGPQKLCIYWTHTNVILEIDDEFLFRLVECGDSPEETMSQIHLCLW